MENQKLKVYLASSWFTDRMRGILDILESKLSARDNLSVYSPRRDGIMLPPNQKHDTALRESIFAENIQNIDDADIVVANIDSNDFYNDPGTMYEVGYAMSRNIPVVGFAMNTKNIEERFKGILSGFEVIFYTYPELEIYLDYQARDLVKPTPKSKVLFVGAGNKEVDDKIAAYIMESGSDIRWIKNEHDAIYDKSDEIFSDVEYMIAVIDDRKTLVSWMIGQAYSRGIPVITYSDFNYGINVMLLISVLTHIRGTDELQKFLQKVKREGLSSIPKFDISQMDSM